MGIVDERIKPEQEEKPIQQANQQPGGQQDDEQPTPEEQEAFTRVETAAMEIIYGDKTSPAILKQLQAGADDPAKVLGDTAMMVFSQIDEKAGGKIPETVLLRGALKVLDLLAELAEESRTLPVDDTIRQQAVHYMLIAAAEMGYISESDIASLQEMISSMPPEEVQGIVQSQQQVYGGAVNG